MPTQQEIIKERDLLKGMGLRPIKVWPSRCRWSNPASGGNIDEGARERDGAQAGLVGDSV